MEDDDLFWRCVLEGYADDSYMKSTSKNKTIFTLMVKILI